MEDLFRAVRRACSPKAWSGAVELVRADVVACVGTVEVAGVAAVQFRLRVPGRPVAVQVTLYPEDEEWECDCGSLADACEHVGAATIALKRARERGEEQPQPSRRIAQLSYRLHRKGERLALDRWLVWPDGREQALAGSLASLIAADGRRDDAVLLTPTQADLAIDRIVEARRVAALPLDAVVSLLRLLADTPDVRLEGRRVRASAEPIAPDAVVTGDGAGACLNVSRSSSIVEVVLGGLALCSAEDEGAAGPVGSDGAGGAARSPATLRPLAATSLTGLWLEKLPFERRFEPRRISELLSELVPALQADGVEVRLDGESLARKPKHLPPRLEIEVGAAGDALQALALVVYGDPPEARLHGDRFVQLGRQPIERDEAGERRLVERLRRELDLVPGRRALFVAADAHAVAQRLRAWSGTVVGDDVLGRYPVEPLEPHVALREGGGDSGDVSLEVAFKLIAAGRGERARGDADEYHADPEAVFAAWQQGAQLVALEGGGWAPIPSDWLATHGHRLADLLAAREARGPVARGAHLALAELCRALDHPVPAALSRLAPLIEGFDRLPVAELPTELRAELRPYQRQGVNWLSFMQSAGLGAILADDMGLGKTLQALCAMRGRSLVVAPTSVVHNWAHEIARFRPSLRVCLYHGPARKLEPEADVTLTSFALLRLDADTLERESWDTVVIDEAQAIKNPESQLAQAACRLDARFRVALTGTPVENRLDELWSLGHFTNPGLLGGRTDFHTRYAQPIAEARPGAAERLRQRIRPFMLRRTKGEVATDLPPRTEAVLLCELDDAERAVYDTVRLATRERLVRELEQGASVLAVLEALLRLRQAACHAALVPGQHAESSAKVVRLVSALEELASSGHRALVFSQWTSLLDLLEPHLRTADLGFVRLDGSTRDRAAVVAAFQASDGPPVMLLSLKAGGTGLNLTAADHVFLLDPWWNPAVEDQAADRTHRIGQDRPVMVYRLVAKDTVEERILALQRQKRAIADAALADADGAASLSRADLLALLE